MQNTFFDTIGIDPIYFIIFLFIIQVILIILFIGVNMKYNRLKASYSSFMKGKDGKHLEESIMARLSDIDQALQISHKNQEDIKHIYKKMKAHYQKIGIVRYDAFQEMGGDLSFALTMLNEDDSGWIINAMHSRESCYTYIKEVVKGESYIELAEEEVESLKRAVYQENYDLNKLEN